MIAIIILIVLVISGVALFLILRNKHKKANTKKDVQIKKANPEPMNYIKPANFDVGFVEMNNSAGRGYKSANLCNDKVLYPINGLDVNYGSKTASNCPCMQFIQAP